MDVGDSAHSPPAAAGDHKYFANYKEGSDLIKKRLSGGLRDDDDGGGPRQSVCSRRGRMIIIKIP